MTDEEDIEVVRQFLPELRAKFLLLAVLAPTLLLSLYAKQRL